MATSSPPASCLCSKRIAFPRPMTAPLPVPSPGNSFPSSWGALRVVEGALDQVPVPVLSFHTHYQSSVPDLKTRVLEQTNCARGFCFWVSLSGLWWQEGCCAEPLGSQALSAGQAMHSYCHRTTHHLLLKLRAAAAELVGFCLVSIFLTNGSPSLRPPLQQDNPVPEHTSQNQRCRGPVCLQDF